MSEAAKSNGEPNKKIFNGGGQEFNNKFMEWWSEARKSEEPPTPYEFLTNFGIIGDSASEAMIKMFWTMLFNSPGIPGRLNYFVHYLKDALAKDPTGYMTVESLGTDDNRDGSDDDSDGSCGGPESFLEALDKIGKGDVTEQELKAMIEIVEPSEKDLILSIERNYSLDLVNSFFEKQQEVSELHLPSNQYDSWPSGGRVLDDSLLLLIQKHIGKIDSVRLGSRYNRRNGLRWTHNAFARCLSTMIHSESPLRFELCIPEAFETNAEDSMDLRPVLPDQNIAGGIEELTIHFSSQNHAANLAAMELIPSMAGLEVLSVHLGPHLKIASPYLAQCLQPETFLREIYITASRIDKPLEHGLLGVLEALQTNSSIERFHYEGGSWAGMALCESKMLEVLREHNSTIREVKLCRGGSRRPVFVKAVPVFVKAVRKQVDYFLMLNRQGRGRARMPSLQLADFVALLCEKKSLGVIFGLLQERPDLWTKASSSATIGHKRKGSNQEVGQQKQRKMC